MRQNDRGQNHWLAIQSGAWRIGRLCGIIDGDFERWPQFGATMKSILSGRVDDPRVETPRHHDVEEGRGRQSPTHGPCPRQWLFVPLPRYVSISCPQCLTDACPFYTSSFLPLPTLGRCALFVPARSKPYIFHQPSFSPPLLISKRLSGWNSRPCWPC